LKVENLSVRWNIAIFAQLIGKHSKTAAIMTRNWKTIIAAIGVSIALSNNALAKKNQSNWDVAFDLLRTQSDGQNECCVSPLSLQFALGLVNEGATGQTKKQIGALLPKKLPEIGDMIQQSGSISSANSIWISDDIAASVKAKFIDQNRKKFDAEVRCLPFDEAAASQINNWCHKKTNGLIPSIIDKLKKDDKMVLVNALHFKADWQSKFDAKRTKKKQFHLETGTSNVVEMMEKTSYWNYCEAGNCQIIRMDYEAKTDAETPSFAMYVLLPEEGKKLSDILPRLNSEFWQNLSLKSQRIHLQLPKFESDFRTSLVPALQKMGATRMFTADAQFGKISKTKLCVDDVLQKCVIKVDEDGTEAAAVTAITMRLTSVGPNAEKPVEMNVNRPFIYILAETSTDTPVFIGVKTK